MKNQTVTNGVPRSVEKQLAQLEEYFKQKKSKDSKEEIRSTEIAFGISLKSKTVSRDWSKVQANLAKTLRSIFGSTDQNFRILIAGHEKPEIEELQHDKVTWLPVDFPPPVDSSGFSEDRKHKRRVVGAHLRNIGFCGYFMSLDADDWLHYRFVEFIRSRPIADAYVLNTGFMVNISRKEVWLRKRFYRGCGSSAVFYFNNGDFPKSAKVEDSRGSLFGLVLKAHRNVLDNLNEVNKDGILIEFPLAAYVVGHGDNWSVIEGKRDDGVSAKDSKASGEQLKEWFYDYFKISSR